MMPADMKNRIRKLIADDKLEKALEELIAHVSGHRDDLDNQLIQLQATLMKTKKDFRRGLITSEQENQNLARARFAVLEILDDINGPKGLPNGGVGNGRSVKTVFISYNHEDAEVAGRLRQALEQKGVAVRIDKSIMEAGENIQEFIEQSVRDTDVTLSIVSNRSLLSAWVALESIYTFYSQKIDSTKKFIACYTDTDFFRNEFRLDATRHIDAKIEEIDKLIPEYIVSKIDTNDLNSQKTRLYKLRNNLGDILLRLRESLSLDIRGENFKESVNKIVSAITHKHGSG